MTSLHRILLVDTAGSDRDQTVARVQTIAAPDAARVTVLAAIGFVPSLFPGSPLDVSRLIVDEHREHAESTAAALRSAGVDADVRVRVGVPVVEIVQEVLAMSADLVVKIEDPLAARRSKFGSADLQLLRKCPVPVWICRARERSPYRRVIAAVDPSDPRTDRDTSLDARILRWAMRVARLDAAELIVTHAFDLPGGDSLLSGSRRIPLDALAAYVTAAREVSEERVAVLIAREAPTDPLPRCRLVQGRADRVIPEIIAEERADLLVIGTVARAGIAGFLIGNTAEQILGEIDCAVLAVKPKGFVSPIPPAASTA